MLGETVADLGDRTNDNDSNIYDDTGISENDRGDVIQCAICLCEVNIGDRIGDIPCGHIYCVECLKDWLKRKNHCPLCLRGGIATPQRSSNPSSTNNSIISDNPDSDEGQDAAEEGRATPSNTSDDNIPRPNRRLGSVGGRLVLSNFLPIRARRSRANISDTERPATAELVGGGGSLLSRTFTYRVQEGHDGILGGTQQQ